MSDILPDGSVQFSPVFLKCRRLDSGSTRLARPLRDRLLPGHGGMHPPQSGKIRSAGLSVTAEEYAVMDRSVGDLRAARQDLDAVIDEIRGVPGFEDFLAAPDFADVAQVAADIPLVYLAAPEPGGLALVVHGAEVTDLDLPALTADALRDRVEEYRDRHERFRRDQLKSELWAGWTASLSDTTRWLWDVAMAPVLDAIGESAAIALVPCGLLGLLPLHAAWTEDDATPTGRRYAIDHAAITYTANARALATCRRRAAELSQKRVLTVADPWVTTADRLPFTTPEAAAAASAFPNARSLADRDATVEAISDAMVAADVVHFGCHGRANLDEPLRSYLLLAGDRRLELDHVLRMRLRLRLAVLSACETSMPGTDLPDEVVGLPTGLVQAGVAGVVATMWATGQHASALLMTMFYRNWRDSSPAVALAKAQRSLRDATAAELEEEWNAALDDGTPWLPSETGEALLNGLLDLEAAPGDRPWAGIEVWAAPAYTGA